VGARASHAIRAPVRALLLAGAALLGVAAADGGAPAAVLARGAEAIAPFKRSLQEALREGLAEGPVAAISACRVRAPAIAEELSTGGLRVGRTSHRLRNPANVPPAWARPLLEAYVTDPEATPRAVPLPDGRWGYVEPIFTQPLCTTCHGASLAPELAARIEALYPEDRATGFAVDELRGLFWAELPPQAPEDADAP
jgi:hypothetical protein